MHDRIAAYHANHHINQTDRTIDFYCVSCRKTQPSGHFHVEWSDPTKGGTQAAGNRKPSPMAKALCPECGCSLTRFLSPTDPIVTHLTGTR